MISLYPTSAFHQSPTHTLDSDGGLPRNPARAYLLYQPQYSTVDTFRCQYRIEFPARTIVKMLVLRSYLK